MDVPFEKNVYTRRCQYIVPLISTLRTISVLATVASSDTASSSSGILGEVLLRCLQTHGPIVIHAVRGDYFATVFVLINARSYFRPIDSYVFDSDLLRIHYLSLCLAIFFCLTQEF